LLIKKIRTKVLVKNKLLNNLLPATYSASTLETTPSELGCSISEKNCRNNAFKI